MIFLRQTRNTPIKLDFLGTKLLMINRPGSSPARRSFRKDSRAKKRVLLEAGVPFSVETKRVLPAVHPNGPFYVSSYEFSKLALTEDHTGVYDYLRRLLANHRNAVFAKLLTTPGVLSARSVETCSESARTRPTYENLGNGDDTNSIEKRKTANGREIIILSSECINIVQPTHELFDCTNSSRDVCRDLNRVCKAKKN
ncbi:hypothetical protein EVAR_61282_1 [Eumeta japonica]|uniref:Uncharacterized protein n=1 Tax=Eumeta variegata TaxID=151549 RepID=A0A4C1XKM1_EUMVA|nr:hypothetical protein EVAR_61282_1 [Eumeta japonica]